MIIHLYDKKTIALNKTEGEKFKKAFTNKSNDLFDVKGHMIARGAIAYTAPGGFSEADRFDVDPNQKRLAGPGRASRSTVESVRDVLAQKGIYKAKIVKDTTV